MREAAAYTNTEEVQGIFSKLRGPKRQDMITAMKNMPTFFFQVRRNAINMKKKFPWRTDEYPELWDRPLGELREEFGYKVFNSGNFGVEEFD